MTVTLGTTAQTSLTAVKFLPGSGSGVSAADVAAINALIKNDVNVAHPLIPGSFDMSTSRLYIPTRGWMKILPGDYIGVSSRGFPYLVSKDDIASGNWVHT